MRASDCAPVLQTLFSKRSEPEVQFLERTRRLGLLSSNAMLAADTLALTLAGSRDTSPSINV